jgi:predicted enzyme related to lactoylglutathione lyase
MDGVRLRQVVLLARELDPVAQRLRDELGLGEPFHDPGVGEFGLTNAVFALGDQFVEVIAPKQDGTPAGRWLERNGGDGGFMLIFQLDDLEAARARVRDMGIRVVWQADLPEISGTHLHPADTRGALISLDAARPPGSWRWGGPDWEDRAAPGGVDGVTVGVREPDKVAQTWTDVLGARPPGVTFAPDEDEPGVTEVAATVPGRSGTTTIGGVRFRLEESP